MNQIIDGTFAAIHLAAKQGKNELVQLLLTAKANCDLFSKHTKDKKFTALVLASQQGHVSIVNTLLDTKADVNLSNTLAETDSEDEGALHHGVFEGLDGYNSDAGGFGAASCHPQYVVVLRF